MPRCAITWRMRSTAADCCRASATLTRREAAFSDCIDQLKPLLAQDVKSVEALILQSACYSGLADHRTLESVLLRSRVGRTG